MVTRVEDGVINCNVSSMNTGQSVKCLLYHVILDFHKTVKVDHQTNTTWLPKRLRKNSFNASSSHITLKYYYY